MKRRKKPIFTSLAITISRHSRLCRSMESLTKASMELRTRQARSNLVWIGSIFAIRIKGRRERCTKGEPKSSKGAKDDKGEGVSKEELQYTSEAHQKASDEVVGADGGNAVPACSPPAHELA